MYACVCVYVCMCVYMCVCMCVCVCVSVRVAAWFITRACLFGENNHAISSFGNEVRFLKQIAIDLQAQRKRKRRKSPDRKERMKESKEKIKRVHGESKIRREGNCERKSRNGVATFVLEGVYVWKAIARTRLLYLGVKEIEKRTQISRPAFSNGLCWSDLVKNGGGGGVLESGKNSKRGG